MTKRFIMASPGTSKMRIAGRSGSNRRSPLKRPSRSKHDDLLPLELTFKRDRIQQCPALYIFDGIRDVIGIVDLADGVGRNDEFVYP